MRAALFALFVAQSAYADSLTINTQDVSYYFVGSGLVIESNSVSLNATAEAIGDHPGQLFIDSFDDVLWTWHIDLNGQSIDGYGMCSSTLSEANATLDCQ